MADRGNGNSDWWTRAACLGMDTDLFFPELGDTMGGVRAALDTCKDCPVSVECGRYADMTRACGYATCGVWGGRLRKQIPDKRKETDG
ncbi:WhiB family transcriptional regulator [Bifidobacterium eulemuris]|uniref:WhiB family transcriptional regulator n=1 Tax=Bifidobacterium eulemuris TaxID=1765219 RepID=A0A7L9SNB3_9BIFI|nr:WhiB family transcriptional regulator [Bifidobacterium eulemuris]QOL31715.1 WhiB family transcriptional regulator [Bifidobacterium eulemuris]